MKSTFIHKSKAPVEGKVCQLFFMLVSWKFGGEDFLWATNIRRSIMSDYVGWYLIAVDFYGAGEKERFSTPCLPFNLFAFVLLAPFRVVIKLGKLLINKIKIFTTRCETKTIRKCCSSCLLWHEWFRPGSMASWNMCRDEGLMPLYVTWKIVQISDLNTTTNFNDFMNFSIALMRYLCA